MGKRKNEQAPGGDAKRDAPRTKQSLWEGSEATAGDGLDATGLAQASDAEGKLKPAAGEAEDQVEMTHSGAGKSGPWSDGEAVAPEPRQEGKHVPQEGRDTGSGGGGEWPEAASLGAASHPESPQQANPALDEAEEDQPVATAEAHGSAGEDPATDTQTHRGTGNIGDRPEHGSAAAAQEEGAAGGGIALPADAPGRSSSSGVPTEAPDPRHEEGGDGGERRGDADQSQEPPRASVGNAAENEPGAVSEGAAVGERREGASGERPPAPGTTDAVKSAAESLREMPGEADVTNDDAGGGDPPDLAAGAGEGEALGAEDATTDAPRTDVQPPARSGRLLCDGGVAGSALADPAMPGPAPTGAAQLPAAGTCSAVGADPWDEAPLPAELLGLLEGKPLVLPPQPVNAPRSPSYRNTNPPNQLK
ncbi:myristoylated alanine-rich C-kinase substrate-like [Phalacrocorax carbo]|uniref:myristoylated alanine-rich C-kinase substrate-like n=1 Tax=Phalacrocorax carbo TaxID=9209 RepID=UPI00311A90C8